MAFLAGAEEVGVPSSSSCASRLGSPYRQQRHAPESPMARQSRSNEDMIRTGCLESHPRRIHQQHSQTVPRQEVRDCLVRWRRWPRSWLPFETRAPEMAMSVSLRFSSLPFLRRDALTGVVYVFHTRHAIEPHAGAQKLLRGWRKVWTALVVPGVTPPRALEKLRGTVGHLQGIMLRQAFPDQNPTL
jgi:hypothetical protein